MSRLTPRTTVRPLYDLVRLCVRSVDIEEWLLTLPSSALRLRPDLLVAVDDDGIGGFDEGQRAADGFPPALVDHRRREAGDFVGFLVGSVGQALARGGP